MIVSVTKSKALVLRNGGKLKRDEEWKLIDKLRENNSTMQIIRQPRIYCNEQTEFIYENVSDYVIVKKLNPRNVF